MHTIRRLKIRKSAIKQTNRKTEQLSKHIKQGLCITFVDFNFLGAFSRYPFQLRAPAPFFPGEGCIAVLSASIPSKAHPYRGFHSYRGRCCIMLRFALNHERCSHPAAVLSKGQYLRLIAFMETPR